jgi:hypothetical protein
MTESFLSRWTRIPIERRQDVEDDFTREEMIDSAITEAEMVIERYWIGNASEREIATRWLLKAYEANQEGAK